MKEEKSMWNEFWHLEKRKPDNCQDERTVQLELKSFRWAYQTMLCGIFLLNLVRNTTQDFGNDDSITTTCLWILFILIENGRFIYGCYHGIQERFDGIPGKLTYWLNGLLSGFLCMLGTLARVGFGNLLNTLVCWIGVAYYFLLCRMARYRYHVFTEEEEPEASTKLHRVKRVFVAAMVIFYAVIAVSDVSALHYRAQYIYAPASVKLSKEDQELLLEVEDALEWYQNLKYAKLEYENHSDMGDSALYDAEVITQGICWYTPDACCTQVLDGKNAGALRMDFLPNLLLPSMEPKTVALIEKTYRGDGTWVYTVTYNEDYRSIEEREGLKSGRDRSQVVEEYTLNEYGALCAYHFIEEGIWTESGEAYKENWGFTLMSANQAVVEQEMERIAAAG